MGKRKPFFKCYNCVVFRCYGDNKEVYYTVVNTLLNVHRHCNSVNEAIQMCKCAGKMLISERFSDRFRKNLQYLIFGREQDK